MNLANLRKTRKPGDKNSPGVQGGVVEDTAWKADRDQIIQGGGDDLDFVLLFSIIEKPLPDFKGRRTLQIPCGARLEKRSYTLRSYCVRYEEKRRMVTPGCQQAASSEPLNIDSLLPTKAPCSHHTISFFSPFRSHLKYHLLWATWRILFKTDFPNSILRATRTFVTMYNEVFVHLGTRSSSLDQELHEGRDLSKCPAPRRHSDTSNVQRTWRKCGADSKTLGREERSGGGELLPADWRARSWIFFSILELDC